MEGRIIDPSVWGSTATAAKLAHAAASLPLEEPQGIAMERIGVIRQRGDCMHPFAFISSISFVSFTNIVVVGPMAQFSHALFS